MNKTEKNAKPDIAKTRTSLVTCRHLLQFGNDVASPYSPDLIPSDSHLFRNLQNSLNDKTYAEL